MWGSEKPEDRTLGPSLGPPPWSSQIPPAMVTGLKGGETDCGEGMLRAIYSLGPVLEMTHLGGLHTALVPGAVGEMNLQTVEAVIPGKVLQLLTYSNGADSGIGILTASVHVTISTLLSALSVFLLPPSLSLTVGVIFESSIYNKEHTKVSSCT